MHRGIRRWLTANVFAGDGRDTHIKISQEPDTLCEFAVDFALFASCEWENPFRRFRAIDMSSVAAARVEVEREKLHSDAIEARIYFCHFYLPNTRNNLFGQFLCGEVCDCFNKFNRIFKFGSAQINSPAAKLLQINLFMEIRLSKFYSSLAPFSGHLYRLSWTTSTRAAPTD